MTSWRGNELPEGKTHVIDLMPHENYNVTGREIMGVISDPQFIVLGWDPDGGDVYQSGWTRKTGDLFSPTDVGLRRFLVAGGIEEKAADSDKIGQRIWTARYTGVYTLPNGEKIPLSREYEFDTSEGGPRWQVRRESAIKAAVAKIAGTKRISDDDYLDRWLAMEGGQQQEIIKRAELIATRFVNEIAQYGRQRANTGALDGALRKFFLIRSYTEEELKTSCFHILRTRVDLELRRIGLGMLQSKIAETVEMLEGKIPTEALGEILMLVTQNEQEKGRAAAPGGGFFVDDDAIEGEFAAQPDPEEARLFLLQAETETKGEVMQLIIQFYGWEMWNGAKMGARCEGFFGKKWRDLTQGEMLLLKTAYASLAQGKGSTPYKELSTAQKKDLAQQGQHIADIIRKCVHEKRLWRIEDTGDQLELPGLDTQEAQSGNSNNHIVADDESDKE